MNRLLIFVALVCTLMPSAAFAHATPIEMQPRSGAQLPSAPHEVSITFSEHLESGSSIVRVTDQAGNRVNTTDASVAADARTMSVPIRASDGLYTVSWSVVSKDDGHFTRGSYAFAVGSTTVSASASEEVVKIATTKEASLMFLEFLGNSLLWGALAVFVLSRGDVRMRKPLMWLAVVAALCAAGGAGGQILLKTKELAGLHGISLSDALHLYRHTTAGSATMIRGIALTLGGLLVAAVGFRSMRNTAFVLAPTLLVFACFRAIISHATANPFYPTLSVAVNFVHVIEKDLWLGVLLVLCVLWIVRSAVVREVTRASLNLLSANLAVLAVSGCYIIWLHVRQFGNLSATSWGEAVMPLLAAAAVLVVLHVVIVSMLWFKPRSAERIFPWLMGAETITAALVVFFTSIVIITSPPSTLPEPIVLEANSNGAHIELSRDEYEDGKALLTVSGSDRTPTVIIGEREGGLLVPLEKRFDGGYVFPAGLISKPDRVTVVVPQESSYNADVTFSVSPDDLSKQDGHGRHFDLFTVCMILIALSGVAVSAALSFIGRGNTAPVQPGRRDITTVILGGVLSYLIVSFLSLSAAHAFANRFRITCESDGNMWHMMQPTKAGVPVAAGAREGCMWGMGNKAYFFADPREYEYLSSLGDAEVKMETVPRVIRSGVPTDMTFTLTNKDGSPATLLVDMEKYMHVVIVSKDESVFAHIHPDDLRPLTADMIDASQFTVRYSFPKAGQYLVSVDYAHGTQLESKQFRVEVSGGSPQSDAVRTYQSPGAFAGYTVSMDHSGAFAGEVTTLRFNVTKDGMPVTDMKPYLSAVSHISVVKNDLEAFIHTHGEVHAPGAPYPPIRVQNGKLIHSMSAMTSPASFGPTFEAHVLFPSEGRYTVWAQINLAGKIVPASFTVDVE